MATTTTTSTSQVEAFLESTGISQAITLDTLAVSLRRKLNSEGAVCCVRRDGRLRLRALLARRWHCSSSERIKAKIVGDILTMIPHARIGGVELRKRGRYIEAEIAVT